MIQTKKHIGNRINDMRELSDITIKELINDRFQITKKTLYPIETIIYYGIIQPMKHKHLFKDIHRNDTSN